MAVAKIAQSNFGRIKKKIKKVAGRFFASPSDAPGQMDYPVISKVLEAEKRRRKLLNEIGK